MSHSAERLKLSVWTTMYWELSPEDACEHIAGLGWRYVDLSAEHIGEICDGPPVERLERARRRMDEIGVVRWQTHGPMDLNLAHPDEHTRQGHRRILRDRIRQCAGLGVKNLVIHPDYRPLKTAEECERSKALNIEMLKGAADEAAQAGVRIALENGVGYWGEVGVLREVVEQAGTHGVGVCFDTSHANVQKLNIGKALRECGQALCCLHLSDNNGGSDQHLMPYQGKIDWAEVVTALRDIGYDGALNFEMPGEGGCPMRARDRKMRHVAAVMEMLMEGEECARAYAQRAEPLREFCRRGWIDKKFGYA